jgi:cytochrome c oxidase assembly protein subunit 15
VLGPLILGIGWLAWRARDESPRMPFHAGALLVLLLVQAGLGGLTVLDQNSPWSVALHLSTALLLFSVLWLIFSRATGSTVGAAAAVRALSVLLWVLALGAMASAAMTTKSGASLACSTWPLCESALIPDLTDPGVRLNFSHRLLAAGVGIGALALHLACRSQPALRRLSALVLVLALAEIGLGGLVVLWQVPVATAIAHQALGVLAFGAISLLMWRAHAPVPDAEALHVRRLSRA